MSVVAHHAHQVVLTKTLIEVLRTKSQVYRCIHNRRHLCGGVIFGVIFYSWWRVSSWPWSLSDLQQAACDARAAGSISDVLGSVCGDPRRGDIAPLTGGAPPKI